MAADVGTTGLTAELADADAARRSANAARLVAANFAVAAGVRTTGHAGLLHVRRGAWLRILTELSSADTARRSADSAALVAANFAGSASGRTALLEAKFQSACLAWVGTLTAALIAASLA